MKQSDGKQPRGRRNNFIGWIAGAAMAMALVSGFNSAAQAQGMEPREPAAPFPLSYSRFDEAIKDHKVRSATIQKQGDAIYVSGQMTDGTSYYTIAPEDPTMVRGLIDSGARVSVQPEAQPDPFLSTLIGFAPMILLIGVWVFFMRRMQGAAGGRAMGLGKNPAKMLTQKNGQVTFADVAGIDEAKEELQEVVEFLRNPQKFSVLGGKIPKGVLLVGPPGTGKTLTARAVAGEANVPFFTVSGSDFVEMFVGVGASRVRGMFEEAKKNAPCIVFIDEIDAVGRHRGAGLGGGNDEREQTLNQLLVEMDGFEGNDGVILIAATNRPDVLDPALLRPGRFDRQVVVPNPDLPGRIKILGVHLKKIKTAGDVDPAIIARGTPGFSGADLANLVNEAALLAARAGKKLVTMEDVENARDKVMMGPERRSMVMSDDEKKLTAYHEAGHALTAIHQQYSDPIHKATIIPRGRALGMVVRLPERDQFSMQLAQLKAHLVVAYGGRIAEELIFGKDHITTGAESDIQQATGIARRMITEWGFSERLGRVRYASNQQEVFLGHSVTQQKNMSEETARLIDEEVRRITGEAEAEARKIIEDNNDLLHTIAQALLEYETLSGDEIKALAAGEEIRRAPTEPAPPDLPVRHGSVPITAVKPGTNGPAM